MNDILKRVVECQENVNAYKTAQATQADSYIFYKHSTDNLYSSGSGTRIIQVTFIPFKSTEKAVCVFSLADYRNGLSEIFTSYKNPLKTTISVPPDSTTYESWQKQVYVTCISNIDGVLKVE